MCLKPNLNTHNMKKADSSDSVSQILQSLQEFTSNLRKSIDQINNNIDIFQNQISAIRQQRSEVFSKGLPDRKNKTQVVQKNKRARTQRTSKKRISQYFGLARKQGNHTALEVPPVINIDTTSQLQIFEEQQEKPEKYNTLDLDLSLQFEDDFIEDDQQQITILWWKNYLAAETKRISQMDPHAPASEIQKFAENQWKQMTIYEKMRWSKVCENKPNPKKKTRTKTQKDDSKVCQLQLAQFLAKKTQKQYQMKKARTQDEQNKQKKENNEIKATTSTDELISAVSKDHQKQESEKIGISSSALKRLLDSYGV